MARIIPEAEAEREEDEEETGPFIPASSRGRRKIADRRGSLNNVERGVVMRNCNVRKKILITRANGVASRRVACARVRCRGWRGGVSRLIIYRTMAHSRIETVEPLITTDIHQR